MSATPLSPSKLKGTKSSDFRASVSRRRGVADLRPFASPSFGLSRPRCPSARTCRLLVRAPGQRSNSSPTQVQPLLPHRLYRHLVLRIPIKHLRIPVEKVESTAVTGIGSGSDLLPTCQKNEDRLRNSSSTPSPEHKGITLRIHTVDQIGPHGSDKGNGLNNPGLG
ncbi:hypothetical protein U1Q18_010719 [Sarracenia purpurea var. burkii]